MFRAFSARVHAGQSRLLVTRAVRSFSSADVMASAGQAGVAGVPGVESSVLDVADFARIQAEMTAEDERRESLIKRSRDVLKLSKNSIYALHRGDTSRASNMLQEAKEAAKRDLLPIAQEYPSLRYSLSGCLEEWAEALIFTSFLATGKVPTVADLEIVSKEEYLGGLMDFTGEIGRYAVLRATERDIQAVQRCREVVDSIHAQLMLFDFRNGNLRRKYDAVKYTLKKLEQIIYELTLATGSGGGFVPKGSGDIEPVTGGEAGEGEGAEGGEEGAGDGSGWAGGRGGRGGKRPRQERGGFAGRQG